MLGSRLNGQRPLGVGCSDQGVFLDLREIAESLNETHSISANVEFPWLVGRFPPMRHSGAAKICFIPGQIMLYFTGGAKNAHNLTKWPAYGRRETVSENIWKLLVERREYRKDVALQRWKVAVNCLPHDLKVNAEVPV
jgi:hypothetical protein